MRGSVEHETDIARLARKLEVVLERRPAAFGADGHQYRASPPVSERVVAEFEAKHQIGVPAEYRSFVTTVSGGGVGPAHGLIPFEQTTTYERDFPEEIVGRPFPYVEAYNPHDDLALGDFWRREASGGLEKGEYSRRKAAEVSGTLVLCHEGCGYLHLLVVSGPAHGQMWIDGTVSDGGYVPLRVGFVSWYERWLDSVLAGGDGVWWADAESRS